MGIDAVVAVRVRSLRKARELSLDQLADASEVSRSMISLIERGETSATAAVLSKIAAALDVPLAALFADDAPAAEPVSRRAEQPTWTDPATGYVRRQVSPAAFATPTELVEVVFPAGESLAFELGTRDHTARQQIWMLDGSMHVTAGDRTWTLKAGDCLAMTIDQRIAFENTTRRPARYLVVLTRPTSWTKK